MRRRGSIISFESESDKLDDDEISQFLQAEMSKTDLLLHKHFDDKDVRNYANMVEGGLDKKSK